MNRQLLRFVIVGTAGFVVDASVLYVALHFGAGYYIGRVLSFLAAVWTTWQLNRRFTFTPSDNDSPLREGGRYLLAMCGGGVVNYAAYCAVIAVLPKHALLPLVAVGAGSVAGLSFNFLVARHWVYKPSR
ncbi:GtrA family protein [Paraburkholderia rhizosphaerae]|uniref:Putative flippase GtrA n=1 Tax=Paraburkholderia rhizosphaerae TaxID=480658 RepID=A0A4V3HCH3_9BURK|nr:GtrA family protein [Paraburkholderia rhizosphaerae]TDY37134.1 putative flippase GtrA [Paraburkholderia rhizosphaerae]